MSEEKTEQIPAEPTENPPEEKKPKQSKLAKCCTFLYNKKTGEFLGRNCDSWTRIGIFYVCFYIFLFAYFFLFLFIMLAFLDNKKPYHTHDSGLIGSTPIGLSFAPKTGQADSSLVLFSTKTEATHIKHMNEYLDSHNVRDIGPCKKDDFGYKSGNPCFAIRLNKQIGWKPTPMTIEEINAEVKKKDKSRFNPETLTWIKIEPNKSKMKELLSSAWVQCKGTSFSDEANKGEMKYYPYPGIEETNFNFDKKDDKHKPAFVMVQFRNPSPYTPISITCKVIAGNVAASKNTIGGVQFQFMVTHE